MSNPVYRELLEVMKKRRGNYAGMDIPEFFEMVEEMFTPEQAAVNNAMPRQAVTAKEMAEIMGRDEAETEAILESMADGGLCLTRRQDGVVQYKSVPFMPGILEYLFMAGTKTDRDKKIARLIDNYKKAYHVVKPPAEEKIIFPGSRVLTVDRTIESESQIHTYDQIKTYIDKYDSISVAACFCRHKADLLDEDLHGMPKDVCMSFGSGADHIIERLGGRKVTKEEALEVLTRAEDAGLIHLSNNMTDDIGFICNCDRWHCVPVTNLLAQLKPGKFLNSGFEPKFDEDECTACETCIDRCPPEALTMGDDDVPVLDLDKCFGCAVCASGCSFAAISMVAKADFPIPPRNRQELREAFKQSLQA